MIVRIRFRLGPLGQPSVQAAGTSPSFEVATPDFHERPGRELTDRKSVSWQELASGCSMMLVPLYLGAWAMVLWRLAADMRIAGPFFLSDGLFSHWQVWFALAGLLTSASGSLRRSAVRPR
jgi:hypothetical protein